MTNNLKSSWFPAGDPSRSAAMRLFCFHHAGGNALLFKSWQQELGSLAEVCPVQIPGHGSRIREQPLSQMPLLVNQIEEAMQPWLEQPFALFGHSMGASIAFELAHLVRAKHGVQPAYLFVAGRRAPHRPSRPPTYKLPEPLFIEELRRLKGTPEEVLAHPELLAITIPLLRADFELIETCLHIPRPLLDCPIAAFGGLQDHEVTAEDLRAWSEMSGAEFSMQLFPGDHFFVNTSRSRLLAVLAERLRPIVRFNQPPEAHPGVPPCQRISQN